MKEGGGIHTISATFHLTHACNLRCTYCYTGEKVAVGMTAGTATAACDFCLKLAREKGCQHLEVVFFGGEPLIQFPRLCEIVDRLREATQAEGLRVTFKMSTNGLLASEEVVEALRQREVFVSLSVDGPPEVHDLQRPAVGGRDTAGRLAEVMRRLLDWNPHTAVNCVITPATASRADASVAWIFEQGFRYVSTALDWGADWTRPDLLALGRAYTRLGDWYVQRTREGKRFYLSCFDEKIRSRTHGPLEKQERCIPGVRQFSIAPSGNLYPCVQFVKEDQDPRWVIGHVETGFHPNPHATGGCGGCGESARSECTGCALAERCSSWCACINWQSHGRLDEASPLVCEHERMLMPIADRVANRLWKQRDALFLHKHYNPAFPVLNFVETTLERAS